MNDIFIQHTLDLLDHMRTKDYDPNETIIILFKALQVMMIGANPQPSNDEIYQLFEAAALGAVEAKERANREAKDET